MRGRLSSDIKEEIRTRVDLVELAGEHVALKKTGRYYKGLCPFHQEKTPSFHVDREKGLWHCFGCQAGGDAYDFVMRISNLSFSESVEMLARRAGVRLERTPDEARRASERDRLYRALDAAAVWYREQLLHPEKGKAARDYLKRRGVDETTAERFRLGYAPQAWDELLKALSGKGYPPTQLDKGGLINPRPSGDGHYDLLRHRLIFPIVDLQDRPVAFGGRALDQAELKYLNTKETPLFSKGRTLYALNLAREAIRHTDEVIVVEGNMDALTCHQFGFTNAVASLGTSLTLDQVLLMKRFASQAVLVYDSDASGLRAMERAMGLFEEAEMSVRVVVLPSGDPDAYLRETGGEAFRSLVVQALPVFEYQLAMATSRHDPKSVEGKVRITEELVPILAAVRNPIRQAEYIREVAERLDLREDALRQRLRGTVRGRSAVEVSMPVLAGPDRARHQAERILLHLMVLEPPLRETVAGQLSASEFADPRHQALAGVLLGSREGPEVLQELIEDEEAKRLLMHLVFEEPPVEGKDKQRAVQESIDYLTRRIPDARRRETLAKEIVTAQAAGDLEQVRRLQMEYLKLVNQKVPSGKGGEEHG
ncbi:MAG: DNA primase [Armatimonadetes bacterium]|nr:DNA primase [Armatimonadota bacterium]